MSLAGFWREFQPNNQQITVGLYRGKINNVHYLFPQGGVSGAFTTFSDLAPQLRSRDVIILGGVLREQAVAPLGVFDVILMGAADIPRQATSSGVPTGGGATWLAPTSPTALSPLLTLREQGWIVTNIMFGAVASTPAIRLKRQENATYPDASHALIDNCYFATQGLTAEVGIGSESLFHSVIQNCLFQGLTGTAILGESVSIAQPQLNKILNCYFRECVNAIDWPQDYGVIDGNRFKDITTKKIDVNVGADNYVGINFFDQAAASITIANGYIGNASDVWRNYATDGASQTVGVPA